jgi:AcrR family transcriptional regulator
MATTTKQKILDCAKVLFARDGYEGLSMRVLAKESGVGLSSIYHFFQDKDALLKELFKTVSHALRDDCAKLPQRSSAREMLYDRILFHFTHIESVVCVLKYYMHFKPYAMRLESDDVATNAYVHMEDVVSYGVEAGEFESDSVSRDAKLITHMVNGFLLEYFPERLKGKDLEALVGALSGFITRALAPTARPIP